MTAMGFLVILTIVFAAVWIYLGRKPRPRAKLGPDGPNRRDPATGDMEVAAELSAGPIIFDRPDIDRAWPDGPDALGTHPTRLGPEDTEGDEDASYPVEQPEITDDLPDMPEGDMPSVATHLVPDAPAPQRSKVIRLRTTARYEDREQPVETDWSGLHDEVPLPESYAEDAVVALVRNPRSLYVYWERSGLGEQGLRTELGEQWRQSLPVIRVYDLSAGATPGQTGAPALTISVGEHDDHWFVNDGIEPGHRYIVGYERVTPDGAFHLLMQSAPVETPGHMLAPGTFVSDKYGWQPDQQSGSSWR